MPNSARKNATIRWSALPYFSSSFLGTIILFLFFGLVLTSKRGILPQPEIYEAQPSVTEVGVQEYSLLKLCLQAEAKKGDDFFEKNQCATVDFNFDEQIDDQDLDFWLKASTASAQIQENE